MYEIDRFCEERKIPRKIRDAFVAYCKGYIHELSNIPSSDTATGLLMKFTQDELEQRWQEFVLDLRDTLTKK